MKEPKLIPRLERIKVRLDHIIPYNQVLVGLQPASIAPWLYRYQPLHSRKVEWEPECTLNFYDGTVYVEFNENAESFAARKAKHDSELKAYHEWRFKNRDKLEARALKARQKADAAAAARAHTKQLKATALAKLSQEEMKALGLK